jgi:hypothetical protein
MRNKYLFLDTNAYLACLYHEEGGRGGAALLENLFKKAADDYSVLLPAVIKAETEEKLRVWFDELNKSVGDGLAEVKARYEKQHSPSTLLKENLKQLSEESRKQLGKTYDQLRKTLKRCFGAKNIITIDPNDRVLLDSFHRAALRQAPATKASWKTLQGHYLLDVDTIAYVSLLSYGKHLSKMSKGQKSDEIVFCANDSDYSRGKPDSLHPDLENELKGAFKKVRYLRSPLELSKLLFKKALPSREVKSFKEAQREVAGVGQPLNWATVPRVGFPQDQFLTGLGGVNPFISPGISASGLTGSASINLNSPGGFGLYPESIQAGLPTTLPSGSTHCPYDGTYLAFSGLAMGSVTCSTCGRRYSHTLSG